MNVYEEIDQETMMLLLDSLCKRTVEGKQIWENMEYNPISFLQKDIYEKVLKIGPASFNVLRDYVLENR